MLDARATSKLSALDDVTLNLAVRTNGIYEIDGRRHLFVRLLEDGRFAFDDEENLKRLTLRESAFIDLYKAGRIVARDWSVLPVKFREEAERSLDLLPPEKVAKAHWRLAYCVAYDANPVPKTARALLPLIDAVAEAHGHETRPDWRTLNTWLRSRGVSGRRPLKAMRSFEEGRGRKKGVDPDAESIIQDCIKLVFLNRRQLPAGAVVEAVIGEIANRNDELEPGDQIEVPSPSTIHRRIAEHPYYKTMRLRLGRRAAEQALKPLKVAPEATYPLETVIIDHTKLDGWMIFDDTTKLPCGGRPWLTMAIDAYSRYPVGFYVGFEPPSVYSVMICLQQAVGFKTDLFKKFPSIKPDWRAAGLPMKIVADNAKEVVGLSLPRGCGELGIELETSPVRTPKYKGIIERFFRTMNTTFMHRLPGTTYGSAQRLRQAEIDPKTTMSISFDTFQYLFLKWLTQDYCKSKNREIGCAPEKRWIEGTQKRRLQMPERMSDLQVALSRHANAVLSRSGIRYKNLMYRHDENVLQILELARASRVRVKFRFNPTDMSAVYVLAPDGTNKILRCTVDYAKGLSLWQHQIIQEENRKRDRDPKSFTDLMRTRLELMKETDEAIANGLAKSFEARFRGMGSQPSVNQSIPVVAVSHGGQSVDNIVTVSTTASSHSVFDAPYELEDEWEAVHLEEDPAPKRSPRSPKKKDEIDNSPQTEAVTSADDEEDDLEILLAQKFKASSGKSNNA